MASQNQPNEAPASNPQQVGGAVPATTNPNEVPISQLSKPTPLSEGVPSTPQATIIPPPAPAHPQAAASPATGFLPDTNPEDPSGGESQNDTETEKPMWRRIVNFLISWVLIPAGLVFIVHNFIFQAWYVDGQSMEPTFQNGNYLIVSKFDVSWKKLTGQSTNLDIQRGDVVIFNPPDFPTDIYFIKRAIGLPGERVVVKNGTVTIFNNQNPTGVVLSENYVGGITLEGDVDVTVDKGEVFVLGDNRNPQASQDSRYFGPIPMNRMIGTAALRLLPVYEFGQITHPQYNLSAATQ